MNYLFNLACIESNPVLDRWQNEICKKAVDEDSLNIISKTLKEENPNFIDYYQNVMKWIYLALETCIPYFYTQMIYS